MFSQSRHRNALNGSIGSLLGLSTAKQEGRNCYFSPAYTIWQRDTSDLNLPCHLTLQTRPSCEERTGRHWELTCGCEGREAATHNEINQPCTFSPNILVFPLNVHVCVCVCFCLSVCLWGEKERGGRETPRTFFEKEEKRYTQITISSAKNAFAELYRVAISRVNKGACQRAGRAPWSSLLRGGGNTVDLCWNSAA